MRPLRPIRGLLLLPALLTLLLAGCGPRHPDPMAQLQKLPPLPLPPQRLEMIGSSFMPPDEPGWRFVSASSNRLMLGKFGTDPDEATLIMAGTTYTQIFHSPQAFEAYIRSRVSGEAGGEAAPDARPDTGGGEVTMLRQNGSDCARVHMTRIDRQAKNGSNEPGAKGGAKGNNMTFEIVELFCRHPGNDGVVSYLGYSQRYYPGHRDPDFDARAARLLQSLELSEF